MRKVSICIITIMLLVSLVMPGAVQAATLSTNKSEMKVDDIVEVKVSMNEEVESIQFDMKFDNTKYQYVNNSATSKLDATVSNLISDDTVRVSAFNLTETRAKEVTLKFKAISIGLNVPFNIVGTVEIGEKGETFDNPEIKIKKVNSIAKKLVSQYYDENGNVILKHPQTGEDVSVQDKKSIGTYKSLVEGKTIVAYALSNSDRTISIDDIKAEFGEITTKAVNPIKTGDQFEKDGTTYTVVIYGDVNRDGKVTTSDALAIKKYELGKTTFDNIQIEAADVENNNKVTEKDALEVQKFILSLRVTNTDTVIDRFPVEEAPIPEKLIEGITKLSSETIEQKYCYDTDIIVATISSNNDVPLTEDVMNFELEKVPSNAERRNAFSYIDKGNGIFEVRLYATEPGEYVIKPVVSGSAVKGGRIELDSVTINVNEYYTATEIKIFNQKNEDVTSNIVARENKNMQRKVRFYHTYINREGQNVYRDVTEHISAEQVNMTKTTNHISEKYTNLYNGHDAPIVYNEDGEYVSGKGPIEYLSIQGETVGNDVITIKVNNDDGTTFTKDLEVTVNTRAKIQSVIIDGKELNNGGESHINLYTYNPNIDTVKEDAGKFYTILPIKVRDEDGDIVKIMQNSIGKGYTYIKDEKTAVIEIATEVDGTNNLSRDIAIVKKYSLNEDNEYVVENTLTQNIDAIGIAFNSITENSKANLEKGIEINYEGIAGREKVKLNVTIIEKPEELDPSEKDDEENNNVVSGNEIDGNTTNNEINSNTISNNEVVENNNVVTRSKSPSVTSKNTTTENNNIKSNNEIENNEQKQEQTKENEGQNEKVDVQKVQNTNTVAEKTRTTTLSQEELNKNNDTVEKNNNSIVE